MRTESDGFHREGKSKITHETRTTRPERCKPSAQRFTAPGVLGAPQIFAVSCSASIPFGAETLPAGSEWGADKGVRQRAEAGGYTGEDTGTRPGQQKLGSLSQSAGRTGYGDLEHTKLRAAGYARGCSRCVGKPDPSPTRCGRRPWQ